MGGEVIKPQRPRDAGARDGRRIGQAGAEVKGKGGIRAPCGRLVLTGNAGQEQIAGPGAGRGFGWVLRGDRMAPGMTRVGIVTRTRDRPLFVVRALDSVLAQTHQDWCLVLVNDGGDPAALRAAIAEAGLAARLPPGRMRILDHPQSLGRAAAFNRGLAALDTDFVACLDDDDTWHPEFLAALVALWAQTAPLVPDLGGVAAGVTALREDLVTGADGRQHLVPLGEEGLPRAFQRGDFLLGPIAYAAYRHDLYPVQWLIERQAALAAGGFPEAFEVMEDRAFMLRLLQHRRIAMLDRRLANHHRRARRSEDTGQSAAMNTLDNPSYDWRRFSDLALPGATTPEGGGDLAGLVRAVGASVVRELNDETSALWHKINGEAQALAERMSRVEMRLGLAGAARAAVPETPVWSLWDAVGTVQIGYRLAPGVPFLGRMALSYAGPDEGLLLHADPWRGELVLQVPATGGWCALELALDGLAPPGRGLRCSFAAGLDGGGLIETGLVVRARDRRGRVQTQVTDTHVHALPGLGSTELTRVFTAAQLAPADGHKLTIVLPRQAANLRLRLHDLAVSPD